MEIWTVVPAPTLATLAPAATVPELTPWAIPCCLGAGAIGLFAASGWARNVAVACAALALGFALVPWCLLPATIAACEREMSAMGVSDPVGRPGALRGPYDLVTAFTGYRTGGAIRVRDGLAVRTRDGARLALDVYAPAGAGEHPAVIVIYGGAWIFGDRAQCAELATSLARLGYTAIAVDYRHAPRYRFPTQIDDVSDALATIAQHSRTWGVDPNRVAVLGLSAGAQLALLTAYSPQPLRIRAAIGYYAPTDLIEGYRRPPRPDPANVQRILRSYLGGPPDEWPGNYLAASPVDQVRPGLPPTLLITGGRDELVRPGFAFALRDRLREHADRAGALLIPWSNHAFDAIPNGTGGQLARYYTQRFLAASL